MKLFNLPDLGEGLPEAQIREWYVQVGDQVQTDQALVAVETAKALVDVPAPYDGTIEKLFGQPSDTVMTGNPLVGFAGQAERVADPGTVVGSIERADDTVAVAEALDVAVGKTVTVTPAVRALARRHGVDLTCITPQGQRITEQEVLAAKAQACEPPAGYTSLPAVRKAMVLSMQKSHQEVVPITITDDVDITAWFKKEDLTIRTIQAISQACQAEPSLNSHFDPISMSVLQLDSIDLGLAVDTAHGLYVPVIKDSGKLEASALRQCIDSYKQQAQEKSIAQQDLKGASIVLSNFGAFAAKYGNPIVVPPTVAIVGSGRVYPSPVVRNGEIVCGYLLPISITVDHRVITGGEVARFMQALKLALQ